MNVKVAEVIVDLLIMARQLQNVSADSGQEKEIFELLFRIGETAYAGMAELKRDK
jgi:hypothetical protein